MELQTPPTPDNDPTAAPPALAFLRARCVAGYLDQSDTLAYRCALRIVQHDLAHNEKIVLQHGDDPIPQGTETATMALQVMRIMPNLPNWLIADGERLFSSPSAWGETECARLCLIQNMRGILSVFFGMDISSPVGRREAASPKALSLYDQLMNEKTTGKP